jgi:hypothetical protein
MNGTNGSWRVRRWAEWRNLPASLLGLVTEFLKPNEVLCSFNLTCVTWLTAEKCFGGPVETTTHNLGSLLARYKQDSLVSLRLLVNHAGTFDAAHRLLFSCSRLAELSLRFLDDWNQQDAAAISQFGRLKKLEIKQDVFNSQLPRFVFPQLPNLQDLNLNTVVIDESTPESITGLLRLQQLTLEHCWRKGLHEFLPYLANLRSLTIHGGCPNGLPLSAIAEIPLLQNLYFRCVNYLCEEDWLTFLQRKGPQLKKLRADRIPAAGLVHLPILESLQLNDPVNGVFINALPVLAELTELVIYVINTAGSLRSLQKLPSLVNLQLQLYMLSKQDLEELTILPCLKHVDLDCCVGSEIIRKLSGLSGLVSFRCCHQHLFCRNGLSWFTAQPGATCFCTEMLAKPSCADLLFTRVLFLNLVCFASALLLRLGKFVPSNVK